MYKGKKIQLVPLDNSMDHLEFVYTVRTDPKVDKQMLIPGDTISPGDQHGWYAAIDWKRTRFFIIEAFVSPESSVMVGYAQVSDIDWRARHCEVGWAISPLEWGKGFGTDSVKVLCWYCFNELNMNKVWLRVIQENRKAGDIYEGIGFKDEGLLIGHAFRKGRYHNVRVMALFQGDYDGGD